jgi:hypothetical protein
VIFIKSLAAGMFALIGCACLIALFFWFSMWLRTRDALDAGVIAVPGWPLLIGALLIFGSAFFWSFKRLSK